MKEEGRRKKEEGALYINTVGVKPENLVET
jgi:hypothetical protein